MQLITAAPDLLAVCQRLLKDYDEDGSVTFGCIEDAQAAIAKAQGHENH